ncbi:MAG TPA: phage tail assembly protein [Dehalococcoidia bacterium]|nr:phage tail assembly protein [Dehalococcoidia bacterium]
MLQTEFDFTLPRGYIDRNGTIHRKGRMRLATALDEIAPLRDPRVRQNQAYHTIILLARVVTHLGTLPAIDTGVIEGLFTADLAFLQELYRTKNELADPDAGMVRCPSCGDEFVPFTTAEEVPAAAAPLA